jgi:gliding motility-associated-like protein
MLITSSSVGCADTAFKTINILEGNNISLASNLFLCEGQGKTVSINSNSNSINWYPATGLSCSNCSAPFVNPLVSTSYTIIASNANGCIDTAYLVVSVQAKLPSSIDSNKTICLGDSIRLNASGGTSYTWSPAAYLSNTQINNPLAFPPSTTIYYVAIHQGVCTFDTLQLTLSVNPKPILIAGTSQTITAGASVQLSASGSNIDFYTWTPATTLSCSTCATPTANPTENTVYYITVSNVFGCTANDSVNIKIRCENSQVFLPNTFTPNGDGLNDVFAVRGVGIKNILSFKIYSKWGILLFERTNFPANDYSNGWDGTFNNTPLGNDIFIYTVDAICITGDLIQVKGDIALIK